MDVSQDREIQETGEGTQVVQTILDWCARYAPPDVSRDGVDRPKLFAARISDDVGWEIVSCGLGYDTKGQTHYLHLEQCDTNIGH